MPKYRKIPVEIEARVFQGNGDQDLAAWCGGRLVSLGQGFWKLEIDTLEGTVTASPGDYVIRGVQGEFYPCKPKIFEATYQKSH